MIVSSQFVESVYVINFDDFIKAGFHKLQLTFVFFFLLLNIDCRNLLDLKQF